MNNGWFLKIVDCNATVLWCLVCTVHMQMMKVCVTVVAFKTVVTCKIKHLQCFSNVLFYI